MIARFQRIHWVRPGRRRALAWILAGVALLGVQAPEPVYAQGAGDLVVAPNRIVFEGRTRTASLSLSNRGSTTATFRISVVNMRMDESGGMKEIDQPGPGEQFAGKLFRYSPRQVKLKPGAAQAIRILLRKPKGLKEGEYRSHLLMRAVPDDAGRSIEQAAEGENVAIRLIPIFGLTIPVIIRHGKPGFETNLSDLQLLPVNKDRKLPALKFRINRTGTRSTFGDLVATYLPNGGSPVVLGQITRLAVYTPNTSRIVELRLRVPDGVTLSGGKIDLTYKTIEDEGSKLMSQASLALP